MREIQHLRLADARRRPWKNGRGTTVELALWPAGSDFERGTFQWRISRARVEAAGPFSSFPGFERVLLATSGAGLELAHGELAPRARLRALEPYRFSGDWPTSAELLGGPVDDFNVVARRGAWEADVQVLRLGLRRAREAPAAEHALAHLVRGSARGRVSGEDEPYALETGDTLWVRGLGASDELDLAGASEDALVLLVRLRELAQR
jgi:environmental stress-induced protein Ves